MGGECVGGVKLTLKLNSGQLELEVGLSLAKNQYLRIFKIEEGRGKVKPGLYDWKSKRLSTNKPQNHDHAATSP